MTEIKLTNEQMIQKNIMENFLQFLNKYDKQTTILKGGTALMFGYGLDRFSEDIDLDSTNTHLEKIIKDYCDINALSYNVKKDTPFVKRYMLEYETNKKIKIEISYRNKRLNKDDFQVINGVKIYNIDKLFGMKLNAYNGRDKLRDLYDIVFIFKNYKEALPSFAIDQLKYSLSFKGLEQFDYLIETQDDELVDKNKLAEDFLNVFDELGLIDDKQIESSIKKTNQMNIKERISLAKDINKQLNLKFGKKIQRKDYER